LSAAAHAGAANPDAARAILDKLSNAEDNALSTILARGLAWLQLGEMELAARDLTAPEMEDGRPDAVNEVLYGIALLCAAHALEAIGQRDAAHSTRARAAGLLQHHGSKIARHVRVLLGRLTPQTISQDS